MVTRDDVARKAGVSATTVSHVINKTRYVSDELKKKVLNVVEELKYTPNLVARSLTTKKSNQVAIIINDITNPFYGEIALGMENAAIENGYILMLCIGNKNLDSYIDNFIMRQVDGVYITSITSQLKEENVKKLIDNGIPVVFGSDVTDIYNDFSESSSFLSADFSTGIEEAISYLVSLGHRNIGFLSGLPLDSKYNERFIAYKECLTKYNIDYNDSLIAKTFRELDTSVEGGYETMREILSKKSSVTAVIATNDLMAIGAMKAISEAGLSVPYDISIIGCDNILFSNTTNPPLTTLNVPKYDLGTEAFKLILEKQNSDINKVVLLPTSLVIRGTTAPVK